jgi:hypothetical protein
VTGRAADDGNGDDMRTLGVVVISVLLLMASAIGVMGQDTDPTTTDVLLSGMDTEEVEPGVLRVVNDDVCP